MDLRLFVNDDLWLRPAIAIGSMTWCLVARTLVNTVSDDKTKMRLSTLFRLFLTASFVSKFPLAGFLRLMVTTWSSLIDKPISNLVLF